MSLISVHETVGDVVGRRPALSLRFEAAGIDYCRESQQTIEAVCHEQGLDPHAFVAELEQAVQALERGLLEEADVSAMSLAELVDHIERTHHGYLRDELARLDVLTERVVEAHGADDPRLAEVRETLLALDADLRSHMTREEQILFPMIRRLAASDSLPTFRCGPIANPIQQMEVEHRNADAALQRMRTLTDDFTPPTWACHTYRAMLEALDRLERDMQQHAHKEDDILFPRAIARQAELAERAPV